jgi:hypothetical protein
LLLAIRCRAAREGRRCEEIRAELLYLSGLAAFVIVAASSGEENDGSSGGNDAVGQHPSVLSHR